MLRLVLEGLADSDTLPQRLALCALDDDGRVCRGGNRNPGVRWHDVPETARSLTLLCLDRDAPSRRDNVNRRHRLVPASLPRQPFYHWVLADLPVTLDAIAEGACADGVIARGKSCAAGPGGARPGLNDYTAWFDGDRQMQGEYYGYDGPCPPWNDTLIHRYAVRLFALDIACLPVSGPLTGAAAVAAMDGHVVGEAQVTLNYTLNRDLRQPPMAT